jgi:uncharacterized protein (TIGR03118 family)
MKIAPTSALLASLILAADVPAGAAGVNAFLQHNLVADVAGVADFTDPNLVNAWGIATSATSPFWVNDNGTGLSTVYTSSGSISTLKAIVPAGESGSSPSTPTGIVFNGTGGFAIATGKTPNFIFATESGTVSGWNSTVDATHAILKVDRSGSGAVYKGLAISSGSTGPYLYAANFHSGAIDVFDANWAAVALPGAFADPAVPAGYAPFNIQNLGGKLYVVYARQDAARHDEVPGPGNGYVAVFDLNGNLIEHLDSNGPLNAPWGMALAPATFGAFANALLVGNFGDGRINAFDPATGILLGTLQDASGSSISIPGLWGLIVGNGGNGGDPNSVYFAAGPGDETHGLFGVLQPAPAITSASVGGAAGANAAIGPNTWLSVYGTNLAPTTRIWAASDFHGDNLPTSLSGVTVTVNGAPAYVFYISPRQIDFLAPANMPVGPVQVTTANTGLTSSSVSVQSQFYAPAFFLFGGKYVAATHSDNVSLVGPTTLFPNNAATPAQPGETIVIYGTGFGPTNPAVADGKVVSTPSNISGSVTISIDNVPAQVVSAVLSGAGVYQFNVTVPPTAQNGDLLVTAQVGGYSAPGSVYLTVLRPVLRP